MRFCLSNSEMCYVIDSFVSYYFDVGFHYVIKDLLVEVLWC